jgi:hypothetical protein
VVSAFIMSAGNTRRLLNLIPRGNVIRAAQAGSLQLLAACRQHPMDLQFHAVSSEGSRQAAETCRLAACAPRRNSS